MRRLRQPELRLEYAEILRTDSELTAKKAGFTILELALVMVIIALVIGGVLVGQDMISNAEVRATVSQIEKYNAALNTFRTRFNAIPGDLDAALHPGLLTDTVAGTGVGQGDGNRLLEADGGGLTDMNGELTMFWQHLSEAQLIDGSFNGLQTAATMLETFPRAKVFRIGIGVYSTNGLNYYQIGATSTTTAAAVYAGGLTTLEALNIDNKMDDGRPNAGTVIARGGAVANAAADATATGCVTDAVLVTAAYRVNNTGIVCQQRIRMQL